MASEDQLRKARLEKIERLKAAGSQGFPNDFRATREMEAARKELAATARACEADENAANRRKQQVRHAMTLGEVANTFGQS